MGIVSIFPFDFTLLQISLYLYLRAHIVFLNAGIVFVIVLRGSVCVHYVRLFVWTNLFTWSHYVDIKATTFIIC